ncbi:MAG TPA: RDD family protein [Candidatus Bathyarchaeia archaeon]
MSTTYDSSGSQIDMTNHWLLRIVAAIIDSIPWAIIGYIIFWVLLFNVGWWAWAGWGLGYFLLWPLFFGLFEVIYFTILEGSSSGASLGKRVMGLKVQMLNGSKVTINKAFMRNISKIFWPIFVIDVIVGIATPGPDPRQRYFDRMAGTTVVSVKQAFATAPPPPPPPPPQ